MPSIHQVGNELTPSSRIYALGVVNQQPSSRTGYLKRNIQSLDFVRNAKIRPLENNRKLRKEVTSMRKIELPWSVIKDHLINKELLLPDEEIKEITLMKPRKLRIWLESPEIKAEES